MSDWTETRYTEAQWGVVVAVYAMHGFLPPALPLSDEQATWVIRFANNPRDPHSPSIKAIWGEPVKRPKQGGPWPTLAQILAAAEAKWRAGQPLPIWPNAVWNHLNVGEQAKYRFEVYNRIVNLPHA